MFYIYFKEKDLKTYLYLFCYRGPPQGGIWFDYEDGSLEPSFWRGKNASRVKRHIVACHIVARHFVERTILAFSDEILSNNTYLNFKSVLLEHTQSEGKGHPRYLVNAEEGPDHRKMFSVEVLIGGASHGVGQGRSKKEAQQMAAKDALEKLGLH